VSGFYSLPGDGTPPAPQLGAWADASASYDALHAAILEELDAIRANLARHMEEFGESDGVDWGYPGDLHTALGQLRELHAIGSESRRRVGGGA
jgi:hypothetical protein